MWEFFYPLHNTVFACREFSIKGTGRLNKKPDTCHFDQPLRIPSPSDLARPNLYENPEAGKVSDEDGSVIHPDGQHFLNTLFFQRLMSIELIGKRGDRGPYGILIKVADHEASQILECHEASVLLRDQRP